MQANRQARVNAHVLYQILYIPIYQAVRTRRQLRSLSPKPLTLSQWNQDRQPDNYPAWRRRPRSPIALKTFASRRDPG
jgi:hypothetical protein